LSRLLDGPSFRQLGQARLPQENDADVREEWNLGLA